MEIYLTSVVWTCQTFRINLRMAQEFANYLVESYRQSSDEQFSFEYPPDIPFVREISAKLSGSFGCYRHEWVKPLMLKSNGQKQPDNFDEILQAKETLGKYLNEKCYSEHCQQLSFKYFVKSILILKLLLKVS